MSLLYSDTHSLCIHAIQQDLHLRPLEKRVLSYTRCLVSNIDYETEADLPGLYLLLPVFESTDRLFQAKSFTEGLTKLVSLEDMGGSVTRALSSVGKPLEAKCLEEGRIQPLDLTDQEWRLLLAKQELQTDQLLRPRVHTPLLPFYIDFLEDPVPLMSPRWISWFEECEGYVFEDRFLFPILSPFETRDQHISALRTLSMRALYPPNGAQQDEALVDVVEEIYETTQIMRHVRDTTLLVGDWEIRVFCPDEVDWLVEKSRPLDLVEMDEDSLEGIRGDGSVLTRCLYLPTKDSPSTSIEAESWLSCAFHKGV